MTNIMLRRGLVVDRETRTGGFWTTSPTHFRRTRWSMSTRGDRSRSALSEMATGRDHNAAAMAVWMAGGGVKRGHVVGATDEIGAKAVEVARPIRDLHATILHQLGLDDNRLTHFHEGRFKQLSQIGAKVIEELIA